MLGTISCFWCKRMLWQHGERLHKNCNCWGFGRHRFAAKVIVPRLRRRIAVAIDPSLR